MTINYIANTLAQVDNAINTGVVLLGQTNVDNARREAALKVELKRREHTYRPPTVDIFAEEELEASQKEVKLLTAKVAERNNALRGRDVALAECDVALAARDVALAARDVALAERDASLLDWMLSNEAFKRLSKNYAKKIGVTPEQHQQNLDEIILDVFEENPAFAKSSLAADVKAEKARAKNL